MDLTNVLDVWGGGQLLAFSGMDGTTDFHEGLAARTMHDRTAIHVVLPGKAMISFDTALPAKTRLGGDFFELETSNGPVRGALLDDHHLLIEGACTVDIEDVDKLTLATEGEKTLLAVTSAYRETAMQENLDAAIEARQSWLQGIDLPAGVSDDRQRTLAQCLSVMKTQVYSPEPPFTTRWTTPDRFPHHQCWLWDSAFHAIGWRHIDLDVAREAIEAVLAFQREDGMIPHMGSPAYISDVTQPPVLAMGTLLVHETQPNTDWLRKLYEPLCRYLRWDLEHRATPDGLLHWFIHAGEPNCRCGESGMDNSSRFDTNEVLSAVDFSAYAALECECLASIADAIGKPDEATEWSAQRDRLNERINAVLWNEEAGIYMDAVAETGKQTGMLSSAGFLPLICGAASDAQAKRLAEHLENPDTFGTGFPVASISPSQTEYYSKDMWRGPVWININWFIANGFERYGLSATEAIRLQTLAEIEKQYLALGSLYEYYDDEGIDAPTELLRKSKLEPGGMHQVLHDYGWTATLYVDLAFEMSCP